MKTSGITATPRSILQVSFDLKFKPRIFEPHVQAESLPLFVYVFRHVIMVALYFSRIGVYHISRTKTKQVEQAFHVSFVVGLCMIKHCVKLSHKKTKQIHVDFGGAERKI